MKAEPRNILVLDFGQMGDVVLSLPALGAIRTHFPKARMTVAVGTAASLVVQMSGLADRILAIDRVKLRDGSKLKSVWSLIQLVGQVRRSHYDLVIDLHSLSESNLLGFLSGAPHRVFAQRSGRALDLLGTVRAPFEEIDQHQVDRYLDVLVPLGISSAARIPELNTFPVDDEFVAKLLPVDEASRLIGFFPGGSLAAKRWPLERFAELSKFLEQKEGARSIVFLGPEESAMKERVRDLFSRDATVFDSLTLSQLASAAARLHLLVSNDTGPMHLAAAVGTPVLLLLGAPIREPYWFGPVGEQHRIFIRRSHVDIAVADVYKTAQSMLKSAQPRSFVTGARSS